MILETEKMLQFGTKWQVIPAQEVNEEIAFKEFSFSLSFSRGKYTFFSLLRLVAKIKTMLG